MLNALPENVGLTLQTEGYEGLVAIPGIGPQIAGAIAEMIRTGRWTQLERLRGTLDPQALFSRVPGIGPKLARLVMESLHIDTLEGLEIAAHDGRLAKVPQFGARRTAMVRAELAQMLGRDRQRYQDTKVAFIDDFAPDQEVSCAKLEQAACNRSKSGLFAVVDSICAADGDVIVRRQLQEPVDGRSEFE